MVCATKSKASAQTKKDTLKALTIVHASCAAHMAYCVNKNEIKQEMGVPTVVGHAIMATLCGLRGFRKIGDEEAS